MELDTACQPTGDNWSVCLSAVSTMRTISCSKEELVQIITRCVCHFLFTFKSSNSIPVPAFEYFPYHIPVTASVLNSTTTMPVLYFIKKKKENRKQTTTTKKMLERWFYVHWCLCSAADDKLMTLVSYVREWPNCLLTFILTLTFKIFHVHTIREELRVKVAASGHMMCM